MSWNDVIRFLIGILILLAILGFYSSLGYQVYNALHEKPSPYELVISNTICLENGSANIFRTGGEDRVVWTVAHLVAGKETQEIQFWDLNDEEINGKLSPILVDTERDLALYRAADESSSDILKRAEGFRWTTENFEVGHSVYFIGCSLGWDGRGTLTSGILSRKDRLLDHMDQCSAPTFGGASGGVILDPDSRKVMGLVRGGAGETFTLFIPSRVVQRFCRRNGVSWAFED